VLTIFLGANTGIGYELVKLLAEKGHTVYIGSRNAASGKEAQYVARSSASRPELIHAISREKLIAEGLKSVKSVQIDVTSLPTVTAAVEAITAAEGKLDVLVNNAGISNMTKNQNATSIDLQTIRETMETNFYGTIQTTQAFIPLLRKSTTGAPVILNVSTDMASNAYQARPDAQLHFVAYNTSKAAANSYSIALSHELKKDGFKVNAVTPGFTSTKLNGFGDGGKTARDGALALLPFALLDKDGPTGTFADWNGNEWPW